MITRTFIIFANVEREIYWGLSELVGYQTS